MLSGFEGRIASTLEKVEKIKADVKKMMTQLTLKKTWINEITSEHDGVNKDIVCLQKQWTFVQNLLISTLKSSECFVDFILNFLLVRRYSNEIERSIIEMNRKASVTWTLEALLDPHLHALSSDLKRRQKVLFDDIQ